MSHGFANENELSLDPLPKNLMVQSPGANMLSSKISRGNEIQIGDQVFLASLIILGNSDIDVILGIDWLSANKAVIDCEEHWVALKVPDGHLIYSPKETPTIQLYSLSSLNTPVEPAIHTIPIVRDFPDVFPEEFPGMPPDRQVEFVIELEPGTTPISKRPYKMGPRELA